MPGLPSRFAPLGLVRDIAARLDVQAVAAGAGLGTLVHALATAAAHTGEARFRLAMALAMVAAGSLSFVLYAQQARGRRPRRGAAERLADARDAASLLGCGVLGALHVLPPFTG